MAGFRQLARELVHRAGGTKQDLARRVGVAPSALSRYLSGDTAPDIRTCLLLARESGMDPSVILRAAGHVDEVTLIEALYGQSAARQQSRLSTDEAAVLTAWRALPRLQRRAFQVLMAGLAGPPARGRRGRRA